ncbi:sigma-70 family RNA polymerase sigma factor [Planctomyces sp. SH-PL14]|uniref:sigma-70 family RNA polymerase sigma factor n=1 Tax=Planctomyces sp. SH-PL14 TaxID=1632864 RepID=UPI00078DF74B|nr:sigma-70 family RNA polymerase sigma factor [Planctomyces sp. SH-PL14]AMV16618.1 RNA polymerase sigma factor RpoS [Planctomyces sp. SH-PL14]
MEFDATTDRMIRQPQVSLEEQFRLGAECQAWQSRIARLQERAKGESPSRYLPAAIAIAKRRGAVSRNAIVLSVMRWIAKRAKECRRNPHGMTFEELVSVGALGAMRAAEKWDPSRGIHFLTFADYSIRRLMYRHGGYGKSRKLRLEDTSLSTDVLADIAADRGPNHMATFHDGAALQEDMALVHRLLPKLTAKQQEVIRLRYLCGQWRTFHDVADDLQTTPKAVQDLERHGLAKLAENIRWETSGRP